MKIIKEGKLPKKTVYTGKCARCGCEFEASEEETRKEVKEVACGAQGRFGLGNTTTIIQRYVNCPTKGCNSVVQVYPKLQDEYYR